MNKNYKLSIVDYHRTLSAQEPIRCIFIEEIPDQYIKRWVLENDGHLKATYLELRDKLIETL